jgi:hypothetical protein
MKLLLGIVTVTLANVLPSVNAQVKPVLQASVQAFVV